jgi:hypothetical protein
VGETTLVIRNSRVFAVVSVIGIVLCGGLALQYAFTGGWRSDVSFMPRWTPIVLYAAMALAFAYQLYQRWRHGAPESFAGLNDRQLWIVRILMLVLLARVAVWILWYRLQP